MFDHPEEVVADFLRSGVDVGVAQRRRRAEGSDVQRERELDVPVVLPKAAHGLLKPGNEPFGITARSRSLG